MLAPAKGLCVCVCARVCEELLPKCLGKWMPPSAGGNLPLSRNESSNQHHGRLDFTGSSK